MSDPSGALVVIGVGNVLRTDDAVGARVVARLRRHGQDGREPLPDATILVDGGTLGFDLAGRLDGSRGLVIADAVQLGGPVGEVSVRRGDEVTAAAAGPGPGTSGGVGELLAVARLMGWLPEEVAMVGVEVSDLGPGFGLSPRVEAAVPVAADAVLAELRRIDARAAGRSRGDEAARSAGAGA